MTLLRCCALRLDTSGPRFPSLLRKVMILRFQAQLSEKSGKRPSQLLLHGIRVEVSGGSLHIAVANAQDERRELSRYVLNRSHNDLKDSLVIGIWRSVYFFALRRVSERSLFADGIRIGSLTCGVWYVQPKKRTLERLRRYCLE